MITMSMMMMMVMIMLMMIIYMLELFTPMGCRASFFDLRRHGATLHREQAPLDVSPLARAKRGTVYTHEAIRLLLWVQGFPFFSFINNG